jgi:ATP-dependent DNA helicase RecQ
VALPQTDQGTAALFVRLPVEGFQQFKCRTDRIGRQDREQLPDHLGVALGVDLVAQLQEVADDQQGVRGAGRMQGRQIDGIPAGGEVRGDAVPKGGWQRRHAIQGSWKFDQDAGLVLIRLGRRLWDGGCKTGYRAGHGYAASVRLGDMTLTPTADAQLHEALARHFGFREFRPGQRPIIDSVIGGRDTLAIMPTGQGKSLCYQLPALVMPGVTLVVSPLIALMKDQVDGLLDRGIPATFINSTLDPETQRDRLDGMRFGRYKLVYVAPERFRSQAFVQAMREAQISLVAIDEAHCLSQWGHDFRPDYLKLGPALEALGRPQILAATATATQEVRDDIVRQLNLRDPGVFVSGFDRPNLRYMVRNTPNEAAKLEKLAQIVGWASGGGIVYCATRKNVEKVAEFLSQHEQGVVAYHAGLDEAGRTAAQDRFMSGRARIAVATNAFGMGIDRSDIRFVVHYDIPGTIEAYYQEAGRAGRDGRLSYCILLFQEADRYLQEFFIEGSSPGSDVIQAVYDVLLAEGEDQVFLSQVEIARRLPRKVNDMAIGTCLNVLERIGVIERLTRQDNLATLSMLPWAQAHVKGKLQVQVLQGLKDRFGGQLQDGVAFDLDWLAQQTSLSREQVHQALKSLAEKGVATYMPPFHGRGVAIKQRTDLRQHGFDTGFWATKRQREMNRLERMFGYAYARKCRRRYVLEYFGERAGFDRCGGCDVCMGLAETPSMPGPKSPKPARKAKATPVARVDSEAVMTPVPAEALGDAALVQALKEVRTQLARERNLPAYVVATDAMIEAMAASIPRTEDELLLVKGWGQRKLTLYGEFFLQVLRDWEGEPVAPVSLQDQQRVTKRRMSRQSDADDGLLSEIESVAETGFKERQKTGVEELRNTIVDLVNQGEELEAISQQVNRSPSTVEGHIVALVEAGRLSAERFVDDATAVEVRRIAESLGGERRLRLIRDAIGEHVSWLQIRVALAEVAPQADAPTEADSGLVSGV